MARLKASSQAIALNNLLPQTVRPLSFYFQQKSVEVLPPLCYAAMISLPSSSELFTLPCLPFTLIHTAFTSFTTATSSDTVSMATVGVVQSHKVLCPDKIWQAYSYCLTKSYCSRSPYRLAGTEKQVQESAQ